MKNIFFAALIFSLCSCGGGELDKKNYNKAKENLEEKERDNPLSFLEVRGSERKNIVGQTVIKGTIQNKASVCAYTEVRVKMLFYKAGVLVENHEEVLDEVMKANTTTKFKSKYFTPKGTDSVALSIMSAEVAEVDKK